jgi:hypothetical protein
MDASRPGPLYSSQADDAEAREQIDRFVLDLAERIDLLQDADAAGDLEELIRAVSQLAQDARGVGYETLATVSLRVAEVARQGKAEDAHAELVELTDVAQRVRRGHRCAI